MRHHRRQKRTHGRDLKQNPKHMALLDTFSDAVIFLDQTAMILAVNEQARVIIGTDKRALVGHTLWQAAPRLVTTTFYKSVINAIRMHTPSQMEYRSPITQTEFQVYFSPTKEGIALFFREVTEPTELLDRNLQHYKGCLDLLGDTSERIAILSPDGLVLEISQQPLTDARVQREEVVGKFLTQFPAWAAAPVLQEQLRAAIVQASRGKRVHLEARVCSEYPLDLALTVTPHCDANQQVEYLIFIGQDITERKQEEEELRALVETIPQFIWKAKPDGNVTYVNRRFIVYMDLTLQQVQGDGWLACIHPDDQPYVWNMWQTSIHTGMPYEVEYRLRNGASGTYRWFLVQGAPQRNAQGAIRSWVGSGIDIDERKQAEARVKANEQDLSMLIETMPQLVWTMWPDGKLEYTNQRYRDVTQVDFNLNGDDIWRQFVHPEDIEHTLTLRRQLLKTGEIYENEYRLMDGRTGKYRWFLTRALPIRDESGQVIKWFGTGTDIDDQKRTEEALRQSQVQVQTLMTSTIIGIFVIERETIIKANDTFLRMTGYSQEDVQLRRLNWMQMTPPEYIAITEQAHAQLALHEYIIPYEQEYIGKDGSRLPILVGGVLTQDDPLQIFCFVLDNSARKALEQRKDAFIGIASHELRTPLTSLKLQMQLLKKQIAKQELHKADIALSRMERQLNVAARLVDELLDLSKIQTGQLEYTQETVNLNELLQEIIEVMQQTQTTHTIIMSGPADAVFFVGDRNRLEQVFLNLIGNAIKYSPNANWVEIDLTASTEIIMISVRDYGIGIPREQYKKIFERFYRAAPEHQYTFRGLGIGLSIVLEIVKHHGGNVTVESELGIGSTFQVILPPPSKVFHQPLS